MYTSTDAPSIKVESGLSDFTARACDASELVERIAACLEGEDTKGAVAFVTFTDCVQGATYERLTSWLTDEERLQHLLQVRVFAESCEFLATRSAMGKVFSWRFVRDGVGDEVDYFDEVQYLDIRGQGSARADATDEYVYHSINGGDYCLPMAGAERIKVRNYLSYDEDGLASARDFRVVRLLGKGE